MDLEPFSLRRLGPGTYGAFDFLLLCLPDYPEFVVYLQLQPKLGGRAEVTRQATLLRQIRSYARGETVGQSILVGGHRGSGKSTVVMRAIEDIQREWAQGPQSDGIACAKPFPVYLHSPDLLEKAQMNDEDRMRHVLGEIIRSLHRALAKEIADQFRLVLSQKPGKDLELAHRIRLELDGFPTDGHLRQCWDAAGVLEEGVFPMRPIRQQEALGSPSPDHVIGNPGMNQGMREIVAIHSLTCVRKALGDDRGEGPPEPTPPAPRSGPSSESLNALSPLASLGSGLAVALLGIGTKEFSTAAAAAAGLATTAVSYLFLHLSTAPARSQTLLSHNEPSSLNRALPALIVRLRDTGLVPIFVVDELDKVSNLADFFTWLIRRGKGFLGDRSFWCYLVDRPDYEKISFKICTQVHSVESAFFGRRVLIHYKPEDLVKFVSQTWEVSGETGDWPRENAEIGPEPWWTRPSSTLLGFGCRDGKWGQHVSSGCWSFLARSWVPE
jgi:hypothetical protein